MTFAKSTASARCPVPNPLSIHGVEKTDETGRLCRLNLAMHGLEGEIKHGGGENYELRSANDELNP